MNKWIYRWVNERMDEWTNQSTNEWINNELRNEWRIDMIESKNAQIDYLLNVW